MDNPLNEQDRLNIMNNFSAEFAVALHDLKGWPLVGLTGNGSDWVYLAVKTPDGLILDVNDYSLEGKHIIDEDAVYDLIPANDFIDDGDAWFVPVSYDEACEYLETREDADQEFLKKAAKEILEWYLL